MLAAAANSKIGVLYLFASFMHAYPGTRLGSLLCGFFHCFFWRGLLGALLCELLCAFLNGLPYGVLDAAAFGRSFLLNHHPVFLEFCARTLHVFRMYGTCACISHGGGINDSRHGFLIDLLDFL